MIMIKDDYSISAEDYGIFTCRKEDIVNIIYNTKDRVAEVRFKNGKYWSMRNISQSDLESIVDSLCI